MIVDCALYRDGRRVGSAIEVEAAAQAIANDEGGFAWVRLDEPTTDELGCVAVQFGLPELAVEDAFEAHQRPKLETYDEILFVVLKSARYVDRDEVVELGEILLFLGPRFVVSVRHGIATDPDGVRRRLEADPAFLRLGPSAVLHAVLDRVVDDYGPAAFGVGEDIDELEEEVFSADRRSESPIERIYYLKREVSEFLRAAAPLAGPLTHLSERDLPSVHPELREHLRDVHDHLLRIDEKLTAFRDLLTTILEAHLAQVMVRQNEDMRKISAWVAIAAVPTVIAGVYGMNFQHMPELATSWGYPAVVTLMAGACVGLFLFFRRRGWL